MSVRGWGRRIDIDELSARARLRTATTNRAEVVNVMTAPHCASPRRSETMPAIETAGGIDGRGGGFRGAASAAGVDG